MLEDDPSSPALFILHVRRGAVMTEVSPLTRKIGPIDLTPYLLGVRVIDAEHRQLIGFLNELITAGPGADLPRLVEGLADYVRVHFTVEEELMVAHGFPGYAAHKAQHEEFAARVRSLRETIAEPGSELGPTIRPFPGSELGPTTRLFLARWLVNHIDRTDRELTIYLTAGGW